MDKRAELSMELVIAGAILLVVLVVMIAIFTGFSGKAANSFGWIWGSADDQIKGKETCRSFFGDAQMRCYEGSSCSSISPGDSQSLVEVTPPSGGWSDCKSTAEAPMVCCEVIEKADAAPESQT